MLREKGEPGLPGWHGVHGWKELAGFLEGAGLRRSISRTSINLRMFFFLLQELMDCQEWRESRACLDCQDYRAGRERPVSLGRGAGMVRQENQDSQEERENQECQGLKEKEVGLLYWWFILSNAFEFLPSFFVFLLTRERDNETVYMSHHHAKTCPWGFSTR